VRLKLCLSLSDFNFFGVRGPSIGESRLSIVCVIESSIAVFVKLFLFPEVLVLPIFYLSFSISNTHIHPILGNRWMLFIKENSTQGMQMFDV